MNALIHRDYLEVGSEVHIDMFDDRMEISSPGGIFGLGVNMSGQKLTTMPSRRRNPVLADIFSRLKYMERRGSGFGKILADYGEKIAPTLSTEYDSFILTLPNMNYGMENDEFGVNEPHQEMSEEKYAEFAQKLGLSPAQFGVKFGVNCVQFGGNDPQFGVNDVMVFTAIEMKPDITTAMVAKALPMSKRGAEKLMDRLKEKGLVKHVGADKNGSWVVCRGGEG